MNPQHPPHSPEGEDYSWDRDKFEYQMAQEMLRHYDSLNWQIGSILIAGTLVLTALMFNKDTIALLKQSFWVGLVLLLVGTSLSAAVLRAWLLWFRRHRDYYNLRNNQVLHRIELRRGMFHHLGVVEASLLSMPEAQADEGALATLRTARNAAYGGFRELYRTQQLSKTSGYRLACRLAFAIPFLQLVGIFSLIVLHCLKKL